MQKWTKEERENKIEEKLGCKTIRINSDSGKFNIHTDVGKICDHIDKSNTKLTEESTKSI